MRGGTHIEPPRSCFPVRFWRGKAPMGRYCPNRREQGKYDPSRAAGGGVPGRPGCGHGDRLFPPGFAGGAGWRRGVVASASSAGSDPRSTHGPDSRNGRCKIWPRNRPHGKTTAVRPLLWPSQPARVWTALCRGTLAMPGLCPLTGAAIKTPRSFQRSGGSLFHLRPCLAGAAAMMTTRSLATGAHLENRGFRCGPPRSRASPPQHALRFELRTGNGGQNRRDRGFMMGVRSIRGCGRFRERR